MLSEKNLEKKILIYREKSFITLRFFLQFWSILIMRRSKHNRLENAHT